MPKAIDFFTSLIPFAYSSQRLYWVFLMSSLGMALFFYFFSKTHSIKYLFSKSYWWNSSTHLDFKIFFTNRVLHRLFILPAELAVTFYVIKHITNLFTENSFSHFFEISDTPTWLFITYALIYFIWNDFWRFYQHRLMHKVNWLWEFHKVHHSATTLTPVTLHRAHFVELIVISVFRIIANVSLHSFFLILLSNVIDFWDILGVNAFSFAFNIIGANLRHSHVPISFGFLEKIIISPHQHQLHHSIALKHGHKNLGVGLSLWDQMYKTWIPSPKVKENLVFGLTQDQTNHSNKLTSAYFSPFKTFFKKNHTA